MVLRPPPPPPKIPDPVEQLLRHPAFNPIPSEILVHCQAAPLGVMVRGLMEWFLDAAFDPHPIARLW